MKKIFTFILMVAIFAVVANAQVQLQVKYTAKAPTADGYIDDVDDPWDGDGWVEQNAMSSGSSTSDASSMFQLLHDDDFLYLAVQVSDATPNNDPAISNTYERDCAEIFIAMDTIDADNGAYQSGDWQIRFQREAEEGSYVDGSGSVASSLIGAEGFVWGIETGSSEWVLEATFPIATLQQDAEFDGEFMKFEIQCADNTTGAAGGRTQQMFWLKNTDQQWQNTKDFNVIQLMPSDGTGVNQMANTGSAFVQNEMLKVKNVNGVVNVYDLRGAVVRSAVVNGTASINISDLKAGMYVVKGANLSAKIVK